MSEASIPNPQLYLLEFNLGVLQNYNPGELDVTIDDNLTWFVREPLIEHGIEYDYKLGNLGIADQIFTIYLTVNQIKFNPDLVVESLRKNRMINGLCFIKKDSIGSKLSIKIPWQYKTVNMFRPFGPC